MVTKKTVAKIDPERLVYKSLNEINFIAYEEPSEEYHNELYATIIEKNLLKEYRHKNDLIEYNRITKDGTIKVEKLTKSDIIRHQIHHPENKENERFSSDDLYKSIKTMREFLSNH